MDTVTIAIAVGNIFKSQDHYEAKLDMAIR